MFQIVLKLGDTKVSKHKNTPFIEFKKGYYIKLNVELIIVQE